MFGHPTIGWLSEIRQCAVVITVIKYISLTILIISGDAWINRRSSSWATIMLCALE